MLTFNSDKMTSEGAEFNRYLPYFTNSRLCICISFTVFYILYLYMSLHSTYMRKYTGAEKVIKVHFFGIYKVICESFVEKLHCIQNDPVQFFTWTGPLSFGGTDEYKTIGTKLNDKLNCKQKLNLYTWDSAEHDMKHLS